MEQTSTGQIVLPATHHGAWAGPNRLWITDPANPFRSDGTLVVSERTVRYTWSFKGKDHSGTVDLKGQPAAMKATWTDSFHAADTFTLYGYQEAGVIRLFTTYDAGEATWGWQIELDFRDPEACVMRMFNVMPELGAVPAVVLQGKR